MCGQVSTYKVCVASPEAQKSTARAGSGSQPSGDIADGNLAAGHEDDEELHHRDGARQQELQTWMLLEVSHAVCGAVRPDIFGLDTGAHGVGPGVGPQAA